MSDIDYDKLSPGIRQLVRQLRQDGFETTDSGDGSSHAAGMEGALPFRHVFIKCDTPAMMLIDTRFLAREYSEARVECSWSPGEPPVILFRPDGPSAAGSLEYMKPFSRKGGFFDEDQQ